MTVPVLIFRTTGTFQITFCDARKMRLLQKLNIEQAGVIYDMKPQTLTRALHRYQDKLGIERFRLHDFRHYFASYAHSLGIPGVYIIKAGGWKTDHVMKTVYRDILKDKNLEMQRKKSRTICFLFRDKFRDKFL